MSEVLEASDGRAIKDLRIGIRARKAWVKIIKAGASDNLTEDQIRGFVNAGGLFAKDEDRKALADNLGFDWEGAANFFATIAPIIMEMMAACAI